jgi:hypothetical protein
MKKTDLQQTALAVLQQFLDDFARQCDPAIYPYSFENFEDWIKYRKRETTDYIHGASMFLIRANLAGVKDAEIFYQNLEKTAARLLQEFHEKPTKTELPA